MQWQIRRSTFNAGNWRSDNRKSGNKLNCPLVRGKTSFFFFFFSFDQRIDVLEYSKKEERTGACQSSSASVQSQLNPPRKPSKDLFGLRRAGN